MFASTILFLLFGGALAASTLPSKVIYNLDEAEVLFEQFMLDYGKQYSSHAEKQMKLQSFKENLKRINQKNKDHPHAVFGINKFADLTIEEFTQSYTCLTQSRGQAHCDKSTKVLQSSQSPTSFDWRDKNVVTNVKDQGNCGSCWAFSTTGNIESVYAIKNRNLLEFSEQQLVDCDSTDMGCKGGWMTNAMIYFKENGVMLEEDYGYHAAPGTCHYKKDKVKTKVTGCTEFSGVSETDLVDVLYNTAPLAVALAANDLLSYRGGIMNCTSTEVNHGVLLVGYGVENNVPYWTFKNSWASSFGEGGYFRLFRGANSCGMMDSVIATANI